MCGVSARLSIYFLFSSASSSPSLRIENDFLFVVFLDMSAQNKNRPKNYKLIIAFVFAFKASFCFAGHFSAVVGFFLFCSLNHKYTHALYHLQYNSKIQFRGKKYKPPLFTFAWMCVRACVRFYCSVAFDMWVCAANFLPNFFFSFIACCCMKISTKI